MNAILSWMTGHKTYFAGFALMLYAVIGYALHKESMADAFQIFFNGLGLVGIRHSISTNAIATIEQVASILPQQAASASVSSTQ